MLKLLYYSFRSHVFYIFQDLAFQAFNQAIFFWSNNFFFSNYLTINYINSKNKIGAQGAIGLGTGIQQLK